MGQQATADLYLSTLYGRDLRVTGLRWTRAPQPEVLRRLSVTRAQNKRVRLHWSTLKEVRPNLAELSIALETNTVVTLMNILLSSHQILDLSRETPMSQVFWELLFGLPDSPHCWQSEPSPSTAPPLSQVKSE